MKFPTGYETLPVQLPHTINPGEPVAARFVPPGQPAVVEMLREWDRLDDRNARPVPKGNGRA